MQDNIIAQDIVYALSAAPDGSCWAARGSGLQRSEDGGQTWQPVIVHTEQDEQPSLTAFAAAQGPDERLDMLAGVVGGVLVSRDGGATWTPRGLATAPPFITALVTSPNYAQDGIVLAASIEDGIFRSENHGETWRAWPFGLFDLHVLALAISPAFVQDGTVYAATESGIYRSRNQGRSWHLTSFPMEAAPVLCIAISPQDGRLYAGTEAAGLYNSDDEGQSWQSMPQLEVEGSINAILPGAQDLLVLAVEQCWCSADAGQSWTRCYTDLDLSEGLTAACAPQGAAVGQSLLLGLADGRILRST